MSESSPADVPISSLGRIGVLRPLRHRDFAVLWTGMTVSMVGDGIYYIAAERLANLQSRFQTGADPTTAP